MVTACGIYAYLFQAPTLVIPSGGSIQETQVDQKLQGGGGTILGGLSIILVLAII
jgi:hypothetical protein